MFEGEGDLLNVDGEWHFVSMVEHSSMQMLVPSLYMRFNHSE